MDVQSASHLEIRRINSELAALQNKVRMLEAHRPPAQVPPVQVRWAMTMQDGETSWPGSEANVFPIVFLDSEFTATQGQQTIDVAPRQAAPPVRAYSAMGNWIQPGLPIPAFHLKGLGDAEAGVWWLMDPPKWYIVQLNGALSPGGSAMANIWLYDSTDTLIDTGCEITVWDSGQAAEAVASGSWGAADWIADIQEDGDPVTSGRWVMRGRPTAATQKSRLLARLTESSLSPYSYTTDGSPFDLIGRARASSGGYGNDEGSESNRPALPSATGEVYEIQDVGSGVYKYVSLGAATLVNGTPWKYYKENHGPGGEPTDEDLLLVNKHGSIYVVERPLSWTPQAVFRATTVSGGFLEWDVATGSTEAHYAYSNNQMWGEIAEPDDSSFTGGIKILAPGVRVYEVIVQINVHLSGLTASTVSFTAGMPGGYGSPDPYTVTISTGNFTQTRIQIDMRRLLLYKRGDKTLFTTLTPTPSVTPSSIDATMIIRPWQL